MLKKLVTRAKGLTKRGKKAVATTSMAVSAFALSAIPAMAAPSANADLDTVTTTLTDGASAMKTNAMTIITVCIAIFIVVFGIGWLINIFKKKMSKAA